MSVERNNYTLTVSMNGVDIGVGANEFVSFIITENLNYNCTYPKGPFNPVKKRCC